MALKSEKEKGKAFLMQYLVTVGLNSKAVSSHQELTHTHLQVFCLLVRNATIGG